MATFTIAFNNTMGHEGGYSHDSDDAGGETYWGISRKYHSEWMSCPVCHLDTGT